MKLTGTNKPITYTTHPPPPRTGSRATRTPDSGDHGEGEDRMLRVHYAVPNQQQEPPVPPGQRPGPRLAPQPNTSTSSTTDVTPQIYRHHTPPPRWEEKTVRQVARVTAVIAWGKRPVPFRTRKLRPTAPMVLHPRECGRVGHRRTTLSNTRKRRRAPHHQVRGPSPLTPPTHHTSTRTGASFRRAATHTVRPSREASITSARGVGTGDIPGGASWFHRYVAPTAK